MIAALALWSWQEDLRIGAFESAVAPKWVARGATSKPRPLTEAMREHGVPGMSISVWSDGKIVFAKGYGNVKEGQDQAPTADTLFQAGSLSKPVAAVAALRLVDLRVLKLDEGVDRKLKGWHLPDSTFTAHRKPTLRQLLSHTSGLGVQGFSGYPHEAKLPTLRQIAEGTAPANSPALHYVAEPGERWSYSGGGYVVLQQLLEDATGKGFPKLMGELVLDPCSMAHSTFLQPLPEDRAMMAAYGHVRWRVPVAGRAYVYPELAAAGLWTTPTDLATFGMRLQASAASEAGAILNKPTVATMLTPGLGGFGLGFAIAGKSPKQWFQHSGRNRGFDSLFAASTSGRKGLVVMINANCDTGFIEEVTAAVGCAFGWEMPDPLVIERYEPLDTGILDALVGTYALAGFGTVSLVRNGFRLHCTTNTGRFIPLTPRSANAFDGPGAKATFDRQELTLTLGSKSWSGPKTKELRSESAAPSG